LSAARRRIWCALMPCQFKCLVKDVAPEAAMAVWNLLKDERVRDQIVGQALALSLARQGLRVALVPDVVRRLKAAEHEVVIEFVERAGTRLCWTGARSSWPLHGVSGFTT
jgi:hypothetical protein